MVPNGWKKGVVDDIAKVTSGGTPSRNKDSYWNGHIPWVTTSEVKFGVITDTEQKITQEGLDNSSAKLFPEDTILMAMYGQGKTRGQVAKLGIEASTNQACAALLLHKEHDVDYYYQYLTSQYENIRELANSGGQQNLSAGIIKDIHVPIPPLQEQRKIAKILSTWDKAIATTEKLIETSKQQNKALMQQLLTGKKRLVNPETGKAFEGEWEDKYLNDFSKVIVSPVDKKTVEGEIPVELCNYTDVYYNTNITQKLTFMKATAKQSEIDKFTLEVDDVIITKDSETPGDIAVPALVSEDLNGVVCGYHLAIVRTDKQQANGAFINYLFSMPKTRYYFFTLATGATRFGLSIGGINKAHFRLPPLQEQQKIASVLTAADKETEVLETKLAHFKQEKKALMQQLLTGKRRVKVDEEVAA
ncbi:restriction endonuclease subunit S [Vibrio sp. 947]|uniref:restriction endonuclease subunit S n=1 Tax=Vibrio sp. 947 TaxID=3074619 RepID=UPI002964FFBB|nr:restriction endonuclease subunit S [Vibrio sp. 947]MDW1924907.1 restriction endonuclease subunit S [Vibrio sp. 947]